MHTINGRRGGGGRRFYVSNPIYPELSPLLPLGIGNSSIVDIRRSSTDRKIEGKRSSSLRRKKKSFSPSLFRAHTRARLLFPDIRLLNRGLKKNVNVSRRPDSYLERDSRASG